MKAALIDRYGSIDAVSVADIDIPTLGATDPDSESGRATGKVVIKVV